jgi:probable HAF family extracellular repeat protein
VANEIPSSVRSRFCRRKLPRCLGWLLLTAAFAGAANARAAMYTITDLGTLGGASSQARGINDAGQIVGYSEVAGNAYNSAFLYEDGVMTNIGTTDGSGSAATAINASGQIVGQADGGPALFSNGTITDLNPAGYFGGAGAINAAGVIVGNMVASVTSKDVPFVDSGGQITLLGSQIGTASGVNDSGEVVGSDTSFNQAFLYASGTMTFLGSLDNNSEVSDANAINDAGEIVGASYETGSEGREAVIFSNGQITDIGDLVAGDQESDAYGINNSGQIVGFFWPTGGIHGFLYSDGVMTDLNSLIPANSGWTITMAWGINDEGQIVGYGASPNGNKTEAFLMTPVPEPASISLLVICAGGLMARRRKIIPRAATALRR